MSISSRLRPATLFVAGALLVPCAAFAQDGLPSIVPTDGGTAPVPSAVVSPSTASPNSQPTIESLSFKDVEITQLLDIISTQFDLPIAVSGEISGKIGVINLKGKTAEEALDAVIQVARLSCKKQPDGTYIISKPDPSVAAPERDTVLPLPSITQFGGNRATNNGSGVLRQFGVPTNDISVVDEGPQLSDITGSDAKMRTYELRIKNIKPSWMAYWLDPANHEAPIDVRTSQNQELNYNQNVIRSTMVGNPNQFSSSSGVTGQSFDTRGVVPGSGNPYINPNANMVQTFADPQFGQGNGGGGRNGGQGGQGGRGAGGRGGGQGGVFQLPTGVDRIVAVDPQNALLVFGTPEGVNQLRSTIAFLDRPLRQVEIEAQFLAITTSAARGFGLDFSAARGNFTASSSGAAAVGGGGTGGGLQVGFSRGNFTAVIAAIERSGRGKTLTAPRVTAINNLTATLTQSLNTPIVLTTTNTLVGNAAATQTNQQLFFIQTNISLDVTPTINNDDTITVLMQPQFSGPIGEPNSLGASPIQTQFLRTIANVRDGETIALGGLRTNTISLNKTKVPLLGDIPLLGKLFRSRQTSDSQTELIIFLTARIIRRVGDDGIVDSTTDIPASVGGTG